jgi:hypothetical protein
MGFPAGGGAEGAAADISGSLANLHVVLTAWRTKVQAGTVLASMETEQILQQIVAIRNNVNSSQTIPGLAEAYTRRFFGYTGNLGTDWTAAYNALTTLGSWIVANWPEKSAAGRPAYVEINATTGEQQSFNATITTAQRNALVNNITAVLNAITLWR